MDGAARTAGSHSFNDVHTFSHLVVQGDQIAPSPRKLLAEGADREETARSWIRGREK